MRLSILAILLTVLSACSYQERADKLIYVDLNSTVDTLKLYSLSQDNPKIDTLIAGNGVFSISALNLEPDIYRLECDTLNKLDFVWEDEDNIEIVARRNHFSEATTNNFETQILWQVEALQAKLLAEIDTINAKFTPAQTPANRPEVASQLNKLRQDARLIADSLIRNVEASLVAVPILNLGNGSINLYSTVEDKELIERVGRNLNDLYPQNALTHALNRQLAESHEVDKFLHRFAEGMDEPAFTFVDKYDVEHSTIDYLGQKRIVFYAKDYSPEALLIWQKIVNFRFQNYLIIGLIPEEIDRYGKLNTTFGTLKNCPFTPILEDLQMVVWSVNAEGRIAHFSIPTSVDDITNDW